MNWSLTTLCSSTGTISIGWKRMLPSPTNGSSSTFHRDSWKPIGRDEYDLSDCFLRAKTKHSHVLRIPSPEKSALLHAIHRLEHSFEDTGYASGLYRQTLFLEFMIQLNRAVQNRRIGYLDRGLANPKIVEILNYINSHLTEPLPIDFLAQTFYLSNIT